MDAHNVLSMHPLRRREGARKTVRGARADWKETETHSLQPPSFPSTHSHCYLQTDAFLTSLAMIIVSELGDKTFFIAAVRPLRPCLHLVRLIPLTKLLMCAQENGTFVK